MVTLPSWAIAASSDYFSRQYHTDDEMMSLAIHLSDRNISRKGPADPSARPSSNDSEDGRCTLVSVGMNRMVPLGNSTLHGETVAIQLAQRKIGSYTLSLEDGGGDESEHDDGLFYEEDNDTPKAAEKDKDEKEEGGEDGATTDNATTSGADVCTPVGGRKRQFELFTSCVPCAMCLGATLWSGVSRIVYGATKDDAQAIGFDKGLVYEESYRHLEKCGVGVKSNVLTEEAASVLRRYGNSGLIYNRRCGLEEWLAMEIEMFRISWPSIHISVLSDSRCKSPYWIMDVGVFLE